MKTLFIAICSILLFSACTDSSNDEVVAGKYGMMSSDSPQYTAIVFMNAIYKEKTLDRAIQMSNERFGRIIKNHHTNRNVQRHVLNLRLDELEVSPMSGNTPLFSDTRKKANIEVKISGKFNGEQVVDLKTISMIKESGEWRVTDIIDTIP